MEHIRPITIGETIVLQKCKHKWLNGLTAKIVEVRGPDNFVVESEEGRHIIGSKQIRPNA